MLCAIVFKSGKDAIEYFCLQIGLAKLFDLLYQVLTSVGQCSLVRPCLFMQTIPFQPYAIISRTLTPVIRGKLTAYACYRFGLRHECSYNFPDI